MSNPWTLGSARLRIATPTYAWETNTTPQVNEGPQVILRNGVISLVYSASGSWTDNYCLGLITARVGTALLNPASWTKRSSPMDVAGCSTADGADVIQWPYWGADCQRWYLQAP